MESINKIINDILIKFIPFYLEEALYLNEPKMKLLVSNYHDNYLITKITQINQIVMPIVSSYQELDEETKKNNLSLNINICILLNKYLFFIYATYKICNDIKTKTEKKLSRQSSKRMKREITLYRTSFKEYIREIIKNFNYDIFNIPISDSELSYYLDLNNFNYKYIRKIKLDESYSIPSNINDVISSKNSIINYIKHNIYYINNTIYIKPTYNNTYITMPQYENICWFISILTGITYSDMSKNLLLNNSSSRTNNDYQEFNNFIFYIIDKITFDFKKYNEIINTNCDIFKEIKNKPLYIIKYLCINYIKKNNQVCINIISSIITEILNDSSSTDIIQLFNNFRSIIMKDNDNYFITIFIHKIAIEVLFTDLNITDKNELNNKKQQLLTSIQDIIDIISIDNFNIDKYEILDNHKSIIYILYDLLNINSLFCKCYKNDSKLVAVPTYGISNSSPDIIIIDVINEPSIIKDLSLQFDLNINSSTYELNYNGSKYKLDYVINSTIDEMTCDNCGHCISAIHYDKQQYFYDPAHKIINIKCDENISIPCSLIKQHWSKNIYADICYSLEKCEYYEKQNTDLSIKEKIIDSYNNICFNLNKNITYIYVKIPEIHEIADNSELKVYNSLSSLDEFEGFFNGGSNKISFTYNNKTYQRKIYSLNNKFFIKFNKKLINIDKKL